MSASDAASSTSLAPPRAWLATLVFAGLVSLLYLSFVRYGFNLDDEGTILYQILRTYRGERPYLDFHTGYTPAMFYLNAGLMHVFGVSVLPLRLFLVGTHVLAVVLIFRLALRLAPIAESICAALAYAVFLPFFAGQFASFNIPYPAWYAVVAWLATQLASVRAVETGRRGWLVAAGAMAGLAFSFKPNTGVMAMGAVVLAQLIATPPLAGRVGAWLERSVLFVAFVGVLAVLTFDLWTEQFLLLGIPILVLVAGAGRLRERVRVAKPHELRPVGEGFKDVGAIVLGFVLVAAGWLAYFLPKLGLARFSEEVLLLGAGVERIYLLYYPDISGWSVAVLLLLPLAWLLPWLIERGSIGARGLAVLGALALIGGAIAFAIFGLAPEGFVLSIALQLENLSYFLIPILLAGAVLLWLYGVATRAEGGALDRSRAVLGVMIVYALFLFLQLYPRIDFMHVVISMPSALVIGAGALYQLERWCLAKLAPGAGEPRAGLPAWRWIRVAALAPIVLALAARSEPFLDARFAVDEGFRPREMTRLAVAPMPVELEKDRDHDLRELGAVAEFVSSSTQAGDPIVSFPALAIIPFLTDRATPVPHDYFFAGRPSHADEAAMVQRIAEVRPPLIVTLNDRLGYFSASPAYYFILRDHVLENYVLVRRFGRFDVLARRDLAEARPQWAKPEVVGDGFFTAFADGSFRDEVLAAQELARTGKAADLSDLADRLADVDRNVRGAYVRAFEAVAAREPDGFAAVEKAVAPNRRAKLLFVRALGEWAGTGSLPYLQDVFFADQGRLRWEAARSINYVLARKLADRFRLYDPPKGPLWDLPRPLESEAMVALIDDFVERQRIGPLAAVATAHAGRNDLAGKLEHFEDDDETTWWRMIAALSLVDLGRPEHVRTMLDALNEGTLAEQYVPSLLLDEEIVSRPQVMEALRQTLREGTPTERETVAWMAPYLGEGEAAELLATAVEDSDPRVRHAARWALGEIAAAKAPAAQDEGGAS